jgi:murein DD-endopeptidase MepM/ murein hydrolase activator NlpD
MAASTRRDLYLSVGGTVDPLAAAMKAGRSVLADFGNAANDTVAEVQKAFQNLGGTNVEASARSIEKAYTKTFDSIRANARAVIEAPSGAAAVQVLNSGAAEQAAAAALNQATGLRMVADAAARAAAATEGDSTAARVYATAAEAAAIGAEHHAVAMRDQAAVLKNVETELRRAGAANDVHDQAGRKNTASAGQQRAAMQQLGFQLNDVATQYSSNTPVMQIFAQQSGQVVQAVSMMTNSTKGFLGFLGGPWGAVTAAATIVLVPLVAKLFEGNDALSKQTDELKKNAEETATADQAKQAFRKTEAGAIDDVRKLTDELKKQNDALKTNAELTNIRAKEDLAQLQKDRAKLAKDLAQAQGAARVANSTPTGGVAGSSSVISGQADQKAADLQKRLTDLDAKIGIATAAVQRTRAELADEAAKRAIDPIAQINRKYEGPDGLIELAKKRAIAEHTVDAALTKQLETLRAKQKLEVDAANKVKADAAKAEKAGPLTNFISPVAGGRVSGGFNEQRSDHRHQGVDYAVPVGTPVRAPAGGTVDVAGARQGYGNAIYINFGGGTTARFGHLSKFNVKPGDRVDAGDIIGYSGGAAGAEGSGRSTGPHLHYEVRQNGRAVDPRTGRFRTDAGAAGDDATKRAEQIAQREQAAADKAARDAEAYAQLLGRAKEEQVRLVRGQVTDLARAADLDAQGIALERERLDSAAQAGVTQRRWTQAQADALKKTYSANADLMTQDVRRKQGMELLDQQLGSNRDALGRSNAMLQLQADTATTLQARKAIAMRMLANQEQEEHDQAIKLWGSNDPADWDRAQSIEDGIAAQHDGRVGQIDRQFASPMEAYRDKLKINVGDMDTAIDGVGVDALNGLEDGLSGIVSGTETVAGAFKKMSVSIIADLARIAIQKMILSALPGGSILGMFGLARGGKVEGKATGGRITGAGTGTSDSILAMVDGQRPLMVSNGESIVTAEATARYWPMIDAMNKGTLRGLASGGLVSPDRIFQRRLPSAASVQRAMPAPSQHFYIDAKGSILANELISKMQEIGTVSMIGGSQMAQTEIAEEQSQMIPS